MPEVREKSGERSQSEKESAQSFGKNRRKVTIGGRKCPKLEKKRKKGHNRGKKVPKVGGKAEERSQSEEEIARS
ncbi:hypothetical protein [Heyndrickxia camelliae]|uniref:Uncharacterized protein n=1 Tax=Heyndrickxia camelliae TaxID=1707093 RepID=A0A2N3LIW2_9BACI|nr:hypothetical protein [Heyndrickxia camelliae]PKR84473.1 hypothetical protein CWO92_13890 [Heyndrickxia camelliae]